MVLTEAPVAALENRGHRLSGNGEPLDYVALVAKTLDAIPQAMLDEVRDDA